MAVTKTVVIFLTDGQNTSDSVNELNAAKEAFRNHMQRLNMESVVHCLGFSSSGFNFYVPY
jgi:hypothetical protein